MHPEIDITKRLIVALNKGMPFSETTVFECMNQLNESVGFDEKQEVTRLWATYYWSKYQLIGQQKIIEISQNETLFRDALYKYFGK
jgi:hypothetical protein